MTNSYASNPAASIEDGSGNQNIYPLLKNDMVSKLRPYAETKTITFMMLDTNYDIL